MRSLGFSNTNFNRLLVKRALTRGIGRQDGAYLARLLLKKGYERSASRGTRWRSHLET